MWDIIFLPLLCTLLIECALSAALFRNKRTVYGVFLCNLLTNPLMNAALYFLSWLLGWAGYILGIFFLELIVIGVEAAVLTRFLEWKPAKAAGVSLLLNIISCAAGIWLWMR